MDKQEFCSFRRARLSTERWIEIVFCALNDVRHATDQKKLGIAEEGGFSLSAIRWLMEVMHYQNGTIIPISKKDGIVQQIK